MKKLFFITLLSITFNIQAQNVGINNTSPKTALDVKGGIRNQAYYMIGSGTSIVIPDNQSNINLAGTFSGQFAATINIPHDGQKLIIDNNSNQTGILSGTVDIRKGLNEYTFSDGEWKVLNTNAWSLQGNYNTDPNYNFIGTTDKTDVVLKRYNEEKMRLTENEVQLAVGASVNGKLAIADNIDAPVAGSIRYNATTQDFEGYNGSIWQSFTYKATNGGWGNNAATENQSLIKNTAPLNSNLGSAVSMSNDYLIAGCANGNSTKGLAVIYKNERTTWFDRQTIIPPTLAEGDFFGYSVGISGTYAIIGAPYTDVAGADAQGKAYIYEFTGTVFTLQAELVAPDGSAQEYFGRSVSIYGDYAIVSGAHTRGASFPIPPPMPISKAYIYKRTAGVWALHTTININSTEVTNFGSGVSIDSEFAVIGAQGYQSSAGKAYVYRLTDGVWALHSVLLRPVFQINDNFGFSVAVNNNNLIIGAPDAQINTASGVGQAFMYHFDGSSWQLNSTINANDWSQGQRFGASVSLSGNSAAIGAPGIHVSGYREGKAYVFKKNNNSWLQEALLQASDRSISDAFGNKIAVDNDKIGVAAPYPNVAGTSGKLYFFNQN